MKELGKKYEPVAYEGAGHGFMRAAEDPEANVPPTKKPTTKPEENEASAEGAR